MDNPESKPDRAIDRLHYAKNLIGLAGFTTLFLYCAYLLLTTTGPNGPLVYGIFMFALLLTIIRSIRRVVAIRRVVSTSSK